MASEDNWESFNTPPTAYGEMSSRNQYTAAPFYPDNIPIDPALAGLDAQVGQYTQPNTTNFNQQMPAPMPTLFNQDPNLNIFCLPIPESGSPVSLRQLFQTHTPNMLRSNLVNLRQGMSLQIRSMPEACSAYTESQVESLISDVQLHGDHDIQKSRLCELSSIAAVAAQYLRGHLQPGVFEFFYGPLAILQELCREDPCADILTAHRCCKTFFRGLYASSTASSSPPQSLRYARPGEHSQQVLPGLCIHW